MTPIDPSMRPGRRTFLAQAGAGAGLAAGLALELAPVRVNTVSPGLIATPLWDKLAPDARRTVCERRATPARPPRRPA